MARYKLTKPKAQLPALKKTYDARTKYDWLNIRQDYVEGMEDGEGAIVFPTQAQLVEKYGVPEQQLRNRSSKERWEDHRQAKRRAETLARQKETAKRLAKKAVIFDEKSAAGAEEAMDLIFERFKTIRTIEEYDSKRRQELIAMIENDDIEYDHATHYKELRSLVSSSEYESLAKAYALFQEVGRKAYGIVDGEPAIRNQVTVEVNQVQAPVASEMTKDGDARGAQILRILKNKNLKLPGYTDAIDAEVVDEQLELTDGLESEENTETEAEN